MSKARRNRSEIETRQALDQSPPCVRRICDQAGVGLASLGAEGRFLFVNAALCRMLGYAREELRELTLAGLARPAEACSDDTWAAPVTWNEADPCTTAARFRRKDGSERWLQVSTSATRDEQGRFSAGIAVFQDISDRRQAEADLEDMKARLAQRVEERTSQLKQAAEELEAELSRRAEAERALRESEERYRQLFQGALTGNLMASAEGHLLACNPSLARLLGYASPEVALGHSFESLFLERGACAELLDALRAERQGLQRDLVLRNAQGQPVHVQAKVLGHFDGAGQLVRFSAYLLDTTARRQAEAARQRLGWRLAEALEAERARLSRELHDRAGQDLTALKLGLGLLLREGALAAPARQRLVRLQKLTDHLIGNLHQLAWELRPAVLDDLGLDRALRRYTDEWTAQNGITVDYQSSGLKAERLAPAIEISLYRIAQEALTNVLRHARARRISVLLQRRGDHVSLIVEDDGVGLDLPEGLSDTTAEGRLGLLGMRERAALVGGSLNLESTPGQGTAVFVRVPLGGPPKTNYASGKDHTDSAGRRSPRRAGRA